MAIMVHPSRDGLVVLLFLQYQLKLNQVPDPKWLQIPLRGLKIHQKWTGKTPVFLDQKKVAEVGLPSHLCGIFFFFQKQVQDLGGTQPPLRKKLKIVFEGLLQGSLTIDKDNLCLGDDLLPYLCGTFGFETLPY